MTLLKEVKELELLNAQLGHDDLRDLMLGAKRGEIRLLFEDLPELEYFENLNNTYDPTIFFQTLVSCIKNNVLSHQANIFKIRSEKRNMYNRVLHELKKDFVRNTNEILRNERELSNIIEGELRDELLHYKKFELLNNERITPHFINLAKISSKNDSISKIKNDVGNDFNSEDALGDHIFNYYKNIYKKDNNTVPDVTVQHLENFLGDVGGNQLVINAKLSNLERDELETEISSMELTKSINNANMSSAPGADGISNKFIKQFWRYFQIPLLKLCRFCFERNELPMVFRTANIKLIPKKGDLTKIKNWRPISLLNCFYKIISRVITDRLRKFMDKMTPICQKGYSSTRYCQEVLISVIEGIEKCKINRVKGAVQIF